MPASAGSNVLLVVLDTVRKDHLQPYGYERETTPELAAFAEKATVFDQAIAPAPWTLPVHGSLFTGRYPSGHGADQRSPYLDDVTTLAEILSATGYETGCFTSNAWITPYTKLTRGFDQQNTFFEAVPGDVFSGPLARAWKVINDNNRLQSVASRVVHMGAKLHAKFASEDSADSKTPAVIDRTKSFIDETDDDWFAFVNLMDAHLPYYPPEKYREQLAPGVDPDDVCQNSKEYNAGARDIDDDEWEAIRQLYDAEIAHMDTELGRLFSWLRQTGQWEDTTVIVCADHGELLGEHNLYGHEFSVYDELVNVALMVDHAELPAGRRDDLVELLDLYHTVLDETEGDVTAVDRDAVPLDRSRSLLSDSYREFADFEPNDPGQKAMRRHEAADANYAFVEYAKPVIELQHLEEKASEAGIDLPDDHRVYATFRAARDSRAKYIRADCIPDEGYRIDTDPDESESLDPAEDDAVAAAKAALDYFEDETDPDWDEGPATADESLADADEEIRERLSDLGYVE